MKVKICGLTSLQDALAALDAGADLLGFNFYPSSPRYISPADCAHLVLSLRQHGCRATLVGVFVNHAAAEIVRILNTCRLDLAQLSGDEPPDVLDQVGERAFKALRPVHSAALESGIAAYLARKDPPAWLVDAYQPGQYGGTGQVANWAVARSLAQRASILLAGGLKPENVASAIRQVNPWGVDVASGVEASPGRKDHQKMRMFIAAARAAED